MTMPGHLFFICPTDVLESVVNASFNEESYFLTSLGNSIAFTEETISAINYLIKERDIDEVSFVLCDDNKFIRDALGKRELSSVSGMGNFYREIDKERFLCKVAWNAADDQVLISSNYLIHRVNELSNRLESSEILVNAKVFNRKEERFHQVYQQTVLADSITLN